MVESLNAEPGASQHALQSECPLGTKLVLNQKGPLVVIINSKHMYAFGTNIFNAWDRYTQKSYEAWIIDYWMDIGICKVTTGDLLCKNEVTNSESSQ